MNQKYTKENYKKLLLQNNQFYFDCYHAEIDYTNEESENENNQITLYIYNKDKSKIHYIDLTNAPRNLTYSINIAINKLFANTSNKEPDFIMMLLKDLNNGTQGQEVILEWLYH